MNSPLCFKKLAIRRMYGQTFEGMSVQNLSPSVNIISGPNAAGKTTLARAIALLLWPDKNRHGSVNLEGDFTQDGANWQIYLDGGFLQYRCNGKETDPPLLPDLPHVFYHLPLHELLQATDEKEFADRIRRQASGGYDPWKAAHELGFGRGTPKKNTLTQNTANARKHLIDVQAQQSALWTKRQKLAGLERELEEARTARHRATVLEKAISYHQALKTCRLAETKLSDFPPVLKHLTGTELSRLEEHQKDLSRAENEALEAVRSIESARQDIANNFLSEEGLEEGVLFQLRDELQSLQTAESRCEKVEEAIKVSRLEEQEAWHRVQGGVSPEHAARIDPDKLQELCHLSEDSGKVEENYRALQALRTLFENGDPEALDRQRGLLRDGMVHLLRWLHTRPPEKNGQLERARILLIVCAVVVAIAAITLAVFVHAAWSGLLVLAAGIALALYLLRGTDEGYTNNLLQQIRTDYEHLGIAGPTTWETENVTRHLEELLDERARVSVELAKAQYWTSRKSDLQEVEAKRREIALRRTELTEKTGLDLEFADVVLHYLVEHLIAWQKATTRTCSLEQERQAIQETVQSHLDHLNETFGKYRLDPAENAAEAHQRIEKLDQAARNLEDARKRLTSAEKLLAGARETEKECRERIEQLFRQFNLIPGDENALRSLLEQRVSFIQASDEAVKARGALEQAELALRKDIAFTEDLITADPASLEHEREVAEDLAGRIETLQDRITEIRTLIETAEEGNDLLVAQSSYENLLDTMAREREKNARSIVGHVLTEYVHQQTRDRDLPRVFHRARELFLSFTQNRYRLELDESGFRAYDQIREKDLVLDDLSSGTRVQLLLAVRVAFLELQENGCRLPLILDETLANSDDFRAEEIIQAILHLSKERQVFYFTAQQDEVLKWKRLDTEKICRFISLGEVPDPDKIKPEAVPDLLSIPPKPNGESHGAYGIHLGVPRWSAHQPLGTLHLWYIIDDVSVLWRLMQKGIKRWGQLQPYLENGEYQSIGLTEKECSHYRLLGNVLTVWQKSWSIGRGKPVDRSVIENSGAVSANFIDKVVHLCDKSDGNGQAIIDSLENKEVPGFYKSKIDELESYFRENGFICSEKTLCPDEIESRMLSVIRSDLDDDGLTLERVNRILKRIRTGPVA